jgi:sugar porter (SP) family MFS transporter
MFVKQDIATGLEGRNLKDVMPIRERMWWFYRNLRTLNLLLLCAIITDITNGYDGSMLNGLQSIGFWEKYFDNPEGSRLGVITNGNRFGQVAALLVTAPLIQKFGRRRPIAIGSVILLIGVILQTASHNLATFVLGRVLIGFGNTIQSSTCPVLIAELAYPSQRTTITGIMNSTGSLGSLLAAWITYGTFFIASDWSWRLPSALQACSSVAQLIGSFFVPESPRWLVYNNRREEARRILAKYHAEGDENSALLEFEMTEIDLSLEAEKMMGTSSWKEWVRTPGNRYRFFLVLVLGFIIQWCGNALISYYISKVLISIGITDKKTQLLINGGTNISGFIFGNFFSLFIDKVGRRKMLLTGMAGMFCSFVVLTATAGADSVVNFKNQNLSRTTVAMIFVFGMFYKVAGPVCPSYVAEVSTYELRAKAFVVNGYADAAASIFSNFVNPIALKAIGWKYYIVWCCMLVSNFLIIYFFYPETKGLSLEEVAQRIDGITHSNVPDMADHEKNIGEKESNVVVEHAEEA